MLMVRSASSTSVTAPCRTTPSTTARSAGSPIALGLVELREEKVSFPPTTGRERFSGRVKINL